MTSYVLECLTLVDKDLNVKSGFIASKASLQLFSVWHCQVKLNLISCKILFLITSFD